MEKGIDVTTLLMSIGLGISLIGIIIFMMYRAKQRNLTVGEIFNEIFMREGATIVIVLLISLNVIEAITAASVHKVKLNETAYVIVNPVTRFMMHLLLGLAGAFFAVFTTKALLDLLKSWGPIRKTKPLLWVLDLLLLLICAPLSFALPYINVFIISVATDETTLFKVACQQWFMFWKTNQELGIADPAYSAVSNMSVVMTSSFFSLFAHYFISIVDSVMAVRERYMYGLDEKDIIRKEKAYDTKTGADTTAGKGGDKKDEKKGDKKDEKKDEKDKPANQNMKFVTTLLEFSGVSSGKMEDYKKKCESVIAKGVNTPGLASLFHSLSSLNKRVEDFKSAPGDSESKQRAREEIKLDIKNAFRLEPDNGGFGFDPVP